MTKEPNYCKSSVEVINKIEFFYQMLVTNTESPIESAEILHGVFVRLWLTGSAPGADIDSMLDSLCKGIKLNVQRNQDTQH